MEFRILGPLEVIGARGAVALEGLKPRAVLAVLLLHRNEPVSAERLAVALWGDEAPASAQRTVQVYVSRLRKALDDADLLETTPAGYRLRILPGQLDAARFEAGVEAARRALLAGSPTRASAAATEALTLWRGRPLAELEFEPFAQAEIARLEEARMAALEVRVEADLAAGRHGALVGELRGLVAEHPARERMVAQLMLALYRCGRQTEALDAYREARAVLVEESGLEPGPELRRLHEAVLGQDPSLEPPAPGAARLPEPLDVSAAPALEGREEALGRLRAHWQAARAGDGRLVIVRGVEGIGKTRLAAELAREARRDGAEIRYLAGREAPTGLPEPGELKSPTLLVVDEADGAARRALTRLGNALRGAPVLALVIVRTSDGLTGVRAAEELELGPLDRAAVRAIAGPHVPVDELLADGGGVPGRLHELLRRHTREAAARRVGAGAGRTAAGRAELRSMEAALADDIRELQVAQGDATAVGADGPVRCPFKGLAAYDVTDAPYFFGRERLVAELVARLVGTSLLGIVGPSGSGKSSVLRAGLLPALAEGVLPGSGDWTQVVMRPGERPLRELARATERIADDRPAVLAVDQFEETFTACREEEERADFIARLASDRPGRVVVLAVRDDAYGRCAAYPGLAGRLAAHHVLVGAMRRDELRRAVERPAARAGLIVEPALADALLADVEAEPGALPTLSTALLELWQRRDGRTLRLATYEATGGVRGAVARHAESAFAGLDRAQQAIARGALLRLAGEGADGGVERRRVPLSELAGGEAAAAVVERLARERLLTISAGTVEVAHEALLREWPRLRGWLEEDADGRRLHRHLILAAREWDERGRDDAELYRGARLAGALEWRSRHEPDLNATERDFLDAGRAAEDAMQTRRRRAVTLAVALLVIVTGISTVVAVRAFQRASFERRAADSRTLATRALTHLHDNLALAGLLGLEAVRREPTIEARSVVLSALAGLNHYHRLGLPLKQRAPVETLAISPGGGTLATATADEMISFWDLDTRRRLGAPVPDHEGTYEDLAFSPDGKLLASVAGDRKVTLWDVATRRPLGRPLAARGRVASIAFSPDGRTLATAGDTTSPWTVARASRAIIQLWDVAARTPLGRPLRSETTGVVDMRFSPDGRLLATAGVGSMRLWDVAARRPAGPPLPGPLGEHYSSVAFSPDGSTLAGSTDDSTVRLWDVRTHEPLGQPLQGHMGTVHSVAFSPDGRILASGGDDASVRLWNIVTRRPEGVLVTDTDRPASREDTASVAGVVAVAFSRRLGLLASGDERGDVQLWKPSGGRPLSRPLRGHSNWVRGLAFTGAGTFVSTGLDRTLRVWDLRRTSPLAVTLGLPEPGLAVAAAPDGGPVAVAGGGAARYGMLALWDLRHHRSRDLRGEPGTVKAVAFSPDGDTLASGGDDGALHLWDVASGRPLGRPLDTRAGAVDGLAFAPDGRTVATAQQDGTVRLWDAAGHRSRAVPLRGPAHFLDAVAFAPGGHVLAAAGGDGTIWLWDVESGNPLGPPLTGQGDVVTALSFSADGRTLASAGANHTVRLWDVPSRAPLGGPLPGHTGWVSAVAFSPHGDALVSGGEDKALRAWDPILWSHDAGVLRRRLCAGIQRNLTRAEWREFIPDRRYRATCPGPH